MALQDDLDIILDWCKVNSMSLNAKKCQVMTVCRLHNVSDFNYVMADSVLEKVEKYKYLGIYLTSDLSWDTHVNFICAKANQALGFIK